MFIIFRFRRLYCSVLQSTLEFNVRVQDFIELVRDGKRVDAVK